MGTERSESREDYLESILILKGEKGVVRSIDIAEHFDYSRPSISRSPSRSTADTLPAIPSLTACV